MGTYTFGNITLRAPDRRTAVEEYNALLASRNQQTLDQQGLVWSPNASVVAQPYTGPSQEAVDAYYAQLGADNGGSDSGSGAGPAPTRYDPNADPAYQAFLAALDLQSQQANTSAWRRFAEINQRADEAVPRIQQQGVDTRGAINTSFDARGMDRSGAHLGTLAREQRAENQRIGDVRTQQASQIGAIADQTHATLADLARQRAEKALQLSYANLTG